MAFDWKDKLIMEDEESTSSSIQPVGVTIEPQTGYMEYIGDKLNEPYNKKELFGSKLLFGSLLSFLSVWGLTSESTYGVCSGSIFGVIGINTLIDAITILFSKNENEDEPDNQKLFE